jgi:hypothetical protein
MPSKGIFGIGISIFFLAVVLWGGWNVISLIFHKFEGSNIRKNHRRKCFPTEEYKHSSRFQ